MRILKRLVWSSTPIKDFKFGGMACGSEASDKDDATKVVKEILSATSIR